jgi:hypothetical protein
VGLLLLWCICGLITGVIAANKGREGCLWFFIGILLGPFGIILALVTSPNRKELDKQAVAFGEMKKCPYCAELIKKEAVKCRYCGTDLPASVPAAGVAPVHFTGRFNCPGCNTGQPIEGSREIYGSRYCARCAAER